MAAQPNLREAGFRLGELQANGMRRAYDARRGLEVAECRRMTSLDDGGAWAELLAGAGVVYHEALQRLGIPAMIVDVSSENICAANSAAAEVLDVPVAELLGKRTADVVTLADADDIHRLYGLMSNGTIDGFRAIRHIITARGIPRQAPIWVRTVEIDNKRVAVVMLRPAAGPTADQAAALETLPLESMAVGTATSDGVVERISCELIEILGIEPQAVIGESLLKFVHPADVAAVRRNVLAVDAGGAYICHPGVRLRPATGGWLRVRALIIRLSADAPPPIAFAFMPWPEVERAGSDDRGAQLARTLRSVAAELEAAGFTDGVERLPTSSDFPQLGSLSNREWQILARLVRGDRVPAIASELFLSPSTVRNYLSGIFGTFGVHSQSELLALLRGRK